jgi:hypothetical protein
LRFGDPAWSELGPGEWRADFLAPDEYNGNVVRDGRIKVACAYEADGRTAVGLMSVGLPNSDAHILMNRLDVKKGNVLELDSLIFGFIKPTMKRAPTVTPIAGR